MELIILGVFVVQFRCPHISNITNFAVIIINAFRVTGGDTLHFALFAMSSPSSIILRTSISRHLYCQQHHPLLEGLTKILLMGICINFTTNPINPITKNPTATAREISKNSAINTCKRTLDLDGKSRTLGDITSFIWFRASV
jgi:hypothetical protein